VSRAPVRLALTRRQRQRRDRRGLRIGIPRLFNQYLYGGFFSAYLQSLGILPENIVWSDYTNDEMYRAQSPGAIGPVLPLQDSIAHVHHLLSAP